MVLNLFFLFQDSALMRPGRLDRILYVGPPDQKAREEILKIRMKIMTIDPHINIPEIATLASLLYTVSRIPILNSGVARRKDVLGLK
jgi:SpoVK/Ycf46/Vps4 family AAA+-type ATPase